MPDDPKDKELAARAPPESLATFAQAVQPLVELWNQGTTDREKLQIEAGERGEVRDAEERRAMRWDWRIFGGVSLAVVLFLMTYLYMSKRSAEANDLLHLVFALAGGGSVGYGIGYAKGKKEHAGQE